MLSGMCRRLANAGWRQGPRAAVGGLVVAVALTACGGSGGQDGQDTSGSSRAAQLVEGAYKKATEAGTVTISFEGSQPAAQSPSGPAGPPNRQTTISGTATLDFDKGASTVTIEASGGSDSETRTIKGVQYQKVPKDRRGQVPGKKPWIKIDMAEVGKLQYGQRAAEIADAPPFDPAAVLPYLRAVKSAEKSGTATIRDTATTRYDVTVDLQKGAGGHGPQLQQQTAQLQQQLGRATLAMQVWLDEQGRLRRLETALPGGGQPGQPGAQQKITVTEDFYDYGSSAEIEAPAEGDTADVTKQVVQRQQQMQRQQQQQQAPGQQPQPQPSPS